VDPATLSMDLVTSAMNPATLALDLVILAMGSEDFSCGSGGLCFGIC